MSKHIVFSANNVAVITGAADGIGRAAANRFAEFGMHVVMSDINKAKLEEAAAEVRATATKHGSQVLSETVDVAQIGQVEALKVRAYNAFGRVDVFMNNAGTSAPTTSWGRLDQWQHLLNVNLMGIIHGIQVFTEAMIAQRTPAIIVNTGSKQGITNPPGNPAYNVSKAGVKAATECLQHELRNTADCVVTAHLLVPGYTFTGLTRQRVQEKPAGAWAPAQVAERMIEAVSRGDFYIICPDNEVSSDEDARRILWGAGDLAYNRSPLSRWDPAYADAFKAFKAQ